MGERRSLRKSSRGPRLIQPDRLPVEVTDQTRLDAGLDQAAELFLVGHAGRCGDRHLPGLAVEHAPAAADDRASGQPEQPLEIGPGLRRQRLASRSAAAARASAIFGVSHATPTQGGGRLRRPRVYSRPSGALGPKEHQSSGADPWRTSMKIQPYTASTTRSTHGGGDGRGRCVGPDTGRRPVHIRRRGGSSRAAAAAPTAQTPHWISDAAHDTSPRISTPGARRASRPPGPKASRRSGPKRSRTVPGNGFAGDPAAQTALPPATIGATRANFEGLSNQDNFNFYGGRVNPPDTIGDVGRSQYVEMTNLMIGIFSKATGQRLTDPDPDRCGLGRLPDRRLHRPVRRPGRALRPAGRTAGS